MAIMDVLKKTHGDKNQTFTEAHIREAFRTGLAAGLAVADRTYGDEDFTNAAGRKADAFVKDKGGDWKNLLRYCGGMGIPLMEGEVRYGLQFEDEAAKAGK
jgi:hypothetical protein